jgi:hypothetical protein
MIVDEVLAVDDAEFQKRCLGKMKQISEGRADGVLSEPQHGGGPRMLFQRKSSKNGQSYRFNTVASSS